MLLRLSMLLVMLGIACLNTPVYGQGTGSGSILGTVTDPTGAVVPNAKITITNIDNGFVRTTVSNGTGNFSLPDLPVGHYQLRIEMQGFKTYELKN
ncbi:MAG: carboxypeptidase-like regulatory domain-containing protein, partial [Acidobacteriota bacterium]